MSDPAMKNKKQTQEINLNLLFNYHQKDHCCLYMLYFSLLCVQVHLWTSARQEFYYFLLFLTLSETNTLTISDVINLACLCSTVFLTDPTVWAHCSPPQTFIVHPTLKSDGIFMCSLRVSVHMDFLSFFVRIL